LILGLCCLNVSHISAGQSDLIPAPEGYEWKWCEDIKAGFLCPRGWFFKEEENGGTRAVFISRESIDKEGVFKTGLSVNVIRDASRKAGMPLLEYARIYIEGMKAKTSASRAVQTAGDGVYFKGFSGFFRSESPVVGPVIIFKLILANEKTGTLYIVSFESPAGEWENAWATGKPIVDTIAL